MNAARDNARRIASRKIMNAVRRAFPDCYYCAGIGWCGPGWEDAAAMETKLRAA